MEETAEHRLSKTASSSETLARAVSTFSENPDLVLSHNDADGLSSAALLKLGLERASRVVGVRLVGRGENPWSPEMAAELAGRALGGIFIADLGLRDSLPRPDVPTVVIDHHAPQGVPEGAHVILGYGMEPAPTTSLLAFRALARVADVDDLLWLAALGVVGDRAEDDGFPEMVEARRRYGITALRKAASLVNQPRRAAGGDASPSMALLLKAGGPNAVLSGEFPETAVLEAARQSVRSELEAARRVAPNVIGNIALIKFSSGAQVHPLVAQAWTSRLHRKIVLAANFGFRSGWVHFAARSAEDVDLMAFLAEHAPQGADSNYGSGHRKATGGALRLPDWNVFVRSLGFSTDAEVRR